MTVVSYEQWIEKNPEWQGKTRTEDCDGCDGKGEVECGECGSTVVCSYCHGRGFFEDDLGLIAYKDQVRKDMKLWELLQSENTGGTE